MLLLLYLLLSVLLTELRPRKGCHFERSGVLLPGCITTSSADTVTSPADISSPTYRPSSRINEDSGNGSVGSESAHAFSGPQQTDSPMSRNGSRMALGGASERHLATLNSHQLYDFAYEARQKQMEAEISGGRFGYGRNSL